MVDSCCLCVDLKNGTFMLAFISFILYFVAGFLSRDYVALFVYFIVVGIFCLIGFMGVTKGDASFVKLFAIVYWLTVVVSFVLTVLIGVALFTANVLNPKDWCKTSEELETCITFVVTAKFLVVILSGAKNLLELHYGFVIQSYCNSLGDDQKNRGNNESPDNKSDPLNNNSDNSGGPSNNNRVSLNNNRGPSNNNREYFDNDRVHIDNGIVRYMNDRGLFNNDRDRFNNDRDRLNNNNRIIPDAETKEGLRNILTSFDSSSETWLDLAGSYSSSRLEFDKLSTNVSIEKLNSSFL
ncbi:hypothetical protein GLOIN_2v1665395 [Rhizophagus clarus]|uniref:Uncharacterized protein n=1 Tax=Rhizophagus clarus TaxID=94130 RepID=A0A8H3R1W8_9GLOM|nr:hypothetical protein GLOIN_2v1665395 [Rhizophagus clarus]